METVLKFNQTVGMLEELFPIIRVVNPVGNELQFIGKELVTSIILEDISGRKQSLTSEKENSFNVNFLPAGLYYIVDVNGRSFSYKIIKY
jgi:hypothetical protein